MRQTLIQSLQHAPVIYKGSYPYIIHPLFDGFPSIPPHLLTDVVKDMMSMITSYLPFDKIVTIEAMGIPLATRLSQELALPFTIIRKRHYGFQDEIKVQKKTGYETSYLYVNGLHPQDRIILVDDIISTGGTIKAIIDSLNSKNISILAAFFIVDKGTQREKISKQTTIPFHCLATLEIMDNKVHVH